jgi:RNA polymerase II subunit A C-terminal domain phosphatase SSU72
LNCEFDLTELLGRESTDNTTVHVINIDIKDNHEEATIGAFIISDIAAILSRSDDLDDDIDELLNECEEKTSRPLLHTIAFQ